MRKYIVILIAVFSIGLLQGCSNAGKTKQETYFEWTDSYGRQVRLNEEPHRLVSLSPAITEIFYLIGAEDKLVGVSDFCTYPEAAQGLPKLGGMQNVNMEALLALRPDAVLIGSIVSQKDVQTIERMNIPVIAIKEEQNIEGMADMMRVIGRITGCEESADKAAADWSSRVSRLKAQNARPGAQAHTVYYVVGFGEAGDFTAPRNSHISEIIALAGCRNVGDTLHGWNVSREFLFEADPDIIVVRKEDRHAFCSQYPYTLLTAVKKHHVYPIESGWIDIVSPRNLQAVELLQEIRTSLEKEREQ